MAGERRALRSGGTTVVAALELVVGVLLAVGHPGRPVFLVVGGALALASLVLLLVSARRWRRERAAAADPREGD